MKTSYVLKAVMILLLGYLPTISAIASISILSDKTCEEMAQAGVMSASAPVQCERLRAVTFDYVNFQGQHHKDGKIIVMDAVAPYIANVFKGLYELQFPIQQAKPILHYRGDDSLSMADNNTSAFNYRAIIGKGSLSMHAYGLALDINPIQNPFVQFGEAGQATYSPTAGVSNANRMLYRYSKSPSNGYAEQVIGIFAENGFLYWGGFWDTPIDYQHFQVSREMAKLMAAMSAVNATQFFDQYVKWYRSCKAMYPVAYSQHRVNDYVVYLKNKLDGKSLTETYKNSPELLLEAIQRPVQRSEICVKQ